METHYVNKYIEIKVEHVDEKQEANCSEEIKDIDSDETAEEQINQSSFLLRNKLKYVHFNSMPTNSTSSNELDRDCTKKKSSLNQIEGKL
jgi:hypothetical protein